MKNKVKIIEKIDGVKGVLITDKNGKITYSNISPTLEEKLVTLQQHMESISSSLEIRPRDLTIQFTPDLKIIAIIKSDYVIYVLASRYVDVLAIRHQLKVNGWK